HPWLVVVHLTAPFLHACVRSTDPVSLVPAVLSSRFFLTVPATTELYTLSLHDALPILGTDTKADLAVLQLEGKLPPLTPLPFAEDRKSTRLNSSHEWISYAVFCLKKKNQKSTAYTTYTSSHSASTDDGHSTPAHQYTAS